MTSFTPPKAEFGVNPTEQEFIEAYLLAERRRGVLKALPALVLLSAGLLTAGLWSFGWFLSHYGSAVIPLLLCLSCPVLLFVLFFAYPQSLRRQAAEEYVHWQALLGQAEMRLYPDDAVTRSETLTLTDPYALMAHCIETPRLFVLVKDHERLLVIPKRCLPADKAGDITDFLRLVFTRRRSVMRNWVF